MLYFDITSAKSSISWATIWCVETVKVCSVSVIASGVASEPADLVFAVRLWRAGRWNTSPELRIREVQSLNNDARMILSSTARFSSGLQYSSMNLSAVVEVTFAIEVSLSSGGVRYEPRRHCVDFGFGRRVVGGQPRGVGASIQRRVALRAGRRGRATAGTAVRLDRFLGLYSGVGKLLLQVFLGEHHRVGVRPDTATIGDACVKSRVQQAVAVAFLDQPEARDGFPRIGFGCKAQSDKGVEEACPLLRGRDFEGDLGRLAPQTFRSGKGFLNLFRQELLLGRSEGDRQLIKQAFDGLYDLELSSFMGTVKIFDEGLIILVLLLAGVLA